jgi:peptide/nickel transport system substrate-binding protein
VRAPASDVPTLKRDAKLSVATIDTVYVFNMELDMRDKSPQVSAKDGSPLPKNPLQDAKVREAIDLAIDRPGLAEIAMEGLGAPVNQLVTPNIAGFNKSLPPLKPISPRPKKLMEEAGYPNGFKVIVLLHQRPPAGRPPGRHLDRADAGAHRHRGERQRPARRGLLPGPHARRVLDVMSGWGTLTGEANYTLSSVVHSNDPAKKLGAFNVLGYKSTEQLDKLIEDAAIEIDEAKRNDLLCAGQRHRRQRPAAPADRRGRLGLGNAEGQGHDRARASTRTPSRWISSRRRNDASRFPSPLAGEGGMREAHDG